MTRDRLGASLRLALWIAVLMLAGRLLLAAGSPTMSVPITSLDEMSRWTADTPPAEMAMALLRLAALTAIGYLLAVTALAVTARMLRARRLAVLAARASPAIVRRIVSGGSGVGLALGAVIGALPSPDLVPAPDPTTVTATPMSSATASMTRYPGPTATMTRTVDPTTSATSTASMSAIDPSADAAPVGARPRGEATMTRLDPTSSSSDPSPAARGAGVGTDASQASGETAASAPTLPAAPAHPEVDPTGWIVEPGDSLWSIAEEVMTPPDGSAPDERHVAPYWRQLLEANRAQLVDPGNPDLLVPGQRLVVPPAEG